MMNEKGYTIIYEQRLKDGDLTEAIKKEKPEVLVVRSTKVTGEMIRSEPNLSLINTSRAEVMDEKELLEAVKVKHIRADLNVYVATGKVKNCVNLLDKTPAKHVLSVRHRKHIQNGNEDIHSVSITPHRVRRTS